MARSITIQRRIIVAGIAAVLSIAVAARAAQETPVSVSGEGAAAGLGPAARSSAIQDAQEAIVLDRLEKLAPSRDFSIFTPLLQAAPTFFQSFKLLRETKTEDSTRVEIEGQLLDRKLKREIAGVALEQNFVTPRIIVIAREQLTPESPGDLAKPGIIEKKLQEDLKRIQFEIVSPEALREKIPPEKWEECITGPPEYSAMLARDLLADIVVLAAGTTRIEDERAAGKLNRVRAEVGLRVVRVEDGYVLDAPKAEAVVHCVNPGEGSAQAIEDACGKLIGDAKTAVALGALSGAPEGALLVTIEGTSESAQANGILDAIQRCLNADKHEILYQGDQRVRARIDFAGPVGQIVDCAPGIPVPNGRLVVKSVVDRDVTLILERK